MDLRSNVDTLIDRFKDGDKMALAKAMTLVENGASELVDRIKSEKNMKSESEPWIIGITGAPGVGKSTLIDKLIDPFSTDNKRVFVFAVDPTSKLSGGAILGDRVRMQRYATNDNVFIRSVATRGSNGGVSYHLIDMIDLALAFGYDIVIVETVGAGQIDLDIFDISDTTVLVLMPEQGDGIQTYKAGMTEMADIFVINKADKRGADKMVEQLRVMMSTRAVREWQSPILKVISTENVGIDILVKELKRHRRYLLSSKKIKDRERLRKLMKVKGNMLAKFEASLSKTLEGLSNEELDLLNRHEMYIRILKNFLDGKEGEDECQ
ncbi:MAG: methylmalonyl Co-A mutase-associated GTPase MeaB [Thermotogae bacterium]|nr:methylmalonyl Co-A mutase-associated GTPase MeaB [Thermotogota bacterium]